MVDVFVDVEISMQILGGSISIFVLRYNGIGQGRDGQIEPVGEFGVDDLALGVNII